MLCHREQLFRALCFSQSIADWLREARWSPGSQSPSITIFRVGGMKSFFRPEHGWKVPTPVIGEQPLFSRLTGFIRMVPVLFLFVVDIPLLTLVQKPSRGILAIGSGFLVDSKFIFISTEPFGFLTPNRSFRQIQRFRAFWISHVEWIQRVKISGWRRSTAPEAARTANDIRCSRTPPVRVR